MGQEGSGSVQVIREMESGKVPEGNGKKKWEQKKWEEEMGNGDKTATKSKTNTEGKRNGGVIPRAISSEVQR